MATWPDAGDTRRAELLVKHVRRIQRSREGVASLSAEVVTEAGMTRALAIDAAYVSGVESARAAWSRNVSALFALALTMLGCASSYVIVRLRTSADQLGATKDQLEVTLLQLQRERTKDRELAELKTRFVAMTSHEFRTPLSVISSSAELLQTYGDRWGTERRAEHLARIRRSVSGMTTMLDRILLIGRTEAGMLEFRPTTIALDRLCQEIAQAAEMGDRGKRSLVTHIAPEVGSGHADEKLVRHVLENLLSNAIKYSPEGGTVRFLVERRGPYLECMVEDEGIGIPESDRPRLFDGFHRAKNALHITGTGLGLPVAQRSAELHGGGIEFTSEVGVGTKFKVRLRIQPEGT
jgi:signal transduction histidine kinase